MSGQGSEDRQAQKTRGQANVRPLSWVHRKTVSVPKAFATKTRS